MGTSKPSPGLPGKGRMVRHGMLWVWSESVPVDGSYPMNWWATGGTMLDTLRVNLNEDIAPGVHEFKAGLHCWKRGERVEIVEGDAYWANSVVLLGSVTVTASGQRSSDDS